MTLNRRQMIDLAYALTARRNELLEEIRGDQASADLIADVGEAEMTRDLDELCALEAALKRVEDGTYGLCGDCGEEIPFARLRAQPGARRCLACQAHHEKIYKA